MTDDAMNRALEVLMWLLVAIGVTIPANEFLGGLCLAVAAALAVRYFLPEKDRRELRMTIGIAVLGAVIAAIIGNAYLPDMLVQLKMCAAGAASRFMVMGIAKVGMTAAARSGQVADKVLDRVLSKENEK